MSSEVVQVHNLTKEFGKTRAVDGVSFELNEGDLCGFIGPNGAGKTTTIKILASLMPPTSGSVVICGERLWPDGHRSRVAPHIGYMPDRFGVYENMKVWEYLEFFGLAYGLSAEERRAGVEDILFLTDLHALRDEFVLGLSRGMKQRLALARTLLHNPSLLLLDEPASGLDPQARIEIRYLLSELQEMGKTILISSHILTELATVCNRVCVIEKGNLLFNGTPDELQEKVGHTSTYRIRVHKDQERAAEVLRQDPRVETVGADNGVLEVELSSPPPGHGYLSGVLQKERFHLTLYQPVECSLEEAYMKLLQNQGGE